MCIQYLEKQCFSPGFKPTNKESILKEIAKLAVKNPLLKNFSAKEILKLIKEQEDTTFIITGKGLAIQRCKIKDLSKPIVGLITIPEGIILDNTAEEKTKIVVFLFTPEKEKTESIRCLSSIANRLNSTSKVNSIAAITNVESLLQAFLPKNHHANILESKRKASMFTVIVEDKELFDTVIEIFTEIEDCSVSIIEAKAARSYMYTMPLFHSFLNEAKDEFRKIIIATMKKNEVSNTLYELNKIVDNRTEKTGMVFFVQKIMHLHGHIEI